MRRILLLFVLLCIGTYSSAQLLKARYTVDSAVMCAARQNLHFTDQSTGDIVSWQWNFGDGNTATSQSPTHVYAQPGRYVVKLVVRDAKGNVDSTQVSDKQDAVYLLPVLKVPSYYLMCGNETTATLKDSGYASKFPQFPYSYQWSTGETSSSIQVSKDGLYKVNLQQCGQTVTDSVYVQKLQTALSVTPADSGDYYDIDKDTITIRWNVNFPFPEGSYNSFMFKSGSDYDRGLNTLPYAVGYYYNAKSNFYPGISVNLKSDVVYHCDTVASYHFIPRAPYIHHNFFNNIDTTIITGDTLFLKDSNSNATWLWANSRTGELISTDSTFYTRNAGSYFLKVQKQNDYAYEYFRVNLVDKLTPAIQTMINCDDAVVTCKFGGGYKRTDTIQVYKWTLNGEPLSSERNPPVLHLNKGNYVLKLWVQTASGDTASTAKTLTVTAPWTMSTAIVHNYNCGESFEIGTNINATVNQYQPYSITWSNFPFQGGSIYVNTSGTYIATLKDYCGNIRAVDSISVQVNRLPAAIVNDADTLKAKDYNAAYTYNWYRNDSLVATGGKAPFPTLSGVYKLVLKLDSCSRESAPLTYVARTASAILTFTAAPCDSASWLMHASIENLPANDVIVSRSVDYGDGATATVEEWHRFAHPGTYNISFTAVTAAGWTISQTAALIVPVYLSNAINLSIHRGVQDTIFAIPAYRDHSSFTYKWSKDGKGLQDTNWFIYPSGSGNYEVVATSQYGCDDTETIVYTAPAVTEVTPPAANSDRLQLSADFGNVAFNTDNEFTIELTVKNPGARTLTDTEVINLGTIKSTDPTNLSVAIPDSLACASNYIVRVISSSPADTTNWSGTFAITNQPPPPVIKQVGDSLFTSSIYDLQWYKDNVAISGATSAAIRARANGSYTVAAMNGTGCSSQSDARAVIITAITNVSLGSNTVSAFPNPSEGQVYLKFGYPLTQQVAVKVYNLQGVVVYAINTTQQQQLLELSALPKGFYIVEVSGYGAKKMLTIILQ
ncbi:PKD domain-containing protein [Chitinophaga sp.]|uniref:PKD domain-containing protein n=1 Tax=Chitinophaga sp. TaxID=1869181 RepID=UPI0031E01BED